MAVSAERVAKMAQSQAAERGRIERFPVDDFRACVRDHLAAQTKLDTLRRPPNSEFRCPCCRVQGTKGDESDDEGEELAAARPCAVVDGLHKAFLRKHAATGYKVGEECVTGGPGSGDNLFPTDACADQLRATLAAPFGRGGARVPGGACDGVAQVKAMTHSSSSTATFWDGVFVLGCTHSILHAALPFKGGELAIYPFLLLILSGLAATTLCGDSLCRLRRCANALHQLAQAGVPLPPNLQWPDLSPTGLQLCVNAMHVLGVLCRSEFNVLGLAPGMPLNCSLPLCALNARAALVEVPHPAQHPRDARRRGAESRREHRAGARNGTDQAPWCI